MEELKYWIGLNHFPKFGPARFKKIIKYFSRTDLNLKNAFTASLKEFKNAGIEENIAAEFISARVKINLEQIIADLDKENIKIATINSKIYPKLLKEIYNPPPLLYYKGKLDLNDEFRLAVVGTRKCTGYGQQATERIVRDLAQNKLTIVSGLALGIDTLAHLTALDMGGKTIAVLGSGLDRQSLYPSANRYLADKIIGSNGGVISEFPPGTQPLRHNFPQRNRVISGLSLGTLVVEAGEKSGALITAMHSLEQNREVFAVPGNIFSPASVGPNKLIKMGAKPTTAAQDIIETLDLAQITAYIDNKKIIPESAQEEKIIAQLSHEPIHIDEVVRLTKLDTSTINSTLTIMEMKGMVKNLGGMQYVLAR